MRFLVLGPVEVHGRDGQAGLGGGRQTALVAALAMRANRLVPAEQLIEAVWGEQPPGEAPATVRTYVSRLRRAFDRVEPDGGQRIETRPTGYLLRVEPDELDLDRFRALVVEGRLREGLALWRGPALADVPSRDQDVPSLEEERLAALERRIELDLELGHHGRVVPELRELTGQHPLRERFWAQLMLALHGDGRQDAALAVFEQVSALHAETMGTDPGPALRDAHATILDNRPVPSQLPPAVTGLVGRQALVKEIVELLLDGSAPVVLSGLPGVGKTSLAVHIGHHLRPRFPDGQLHVNLRGYARSQPVTPTEVLARFLRALGVPAQEIPDDLDGQVARYQSLLAGRRTLVVLDNANAATQVLPLLPASPHCAVLVTSRDTLAGLPDAQRFALDPLSPDDACRLLATLTGAQPATTEELARLCGYLPLALRIAAATLADVDSYVAELRGDNRLATLAVDEQTAVRATIDLSYAKLGPDAATLFRRLSVVPGQTFTEHVATALLHGPGASALAELSTASLVQDAGPDRFQFHDLLRLYATRLCADDERAAGIDRLYSLYFQATRTATGLIEPGRQPPHLPDVLAEVALPSIPDRKSALAWIEHEDRNLLAAIDHAATHGPFPYAWHLADTITSPLALAGRYADWVHVSTTGLRMARQCGDRRGEAIMLVSLGHAYDGTGDLAGAVTCLTEAIEVSRLVSWPELEVVCQHTLGMACLWTGELAEAVRRLETAMALSGPLGYDYYGVSCTNGLAIARRYLGDLPGALELLLGIQQGDPYSRATWAFSLALVYRDLGRFDEAVEELRVSRLAYEQLRSSFGAARCLVAAASIALLRDDPRTALGNARMGLELARRIRHRRTEVDALNVLGGALARSGQPDAAREQHVTAVTVAESMGTYRYGWITAQLRLGRRDLAEAAIARCGFAPMAEWG